MSSVVISGDISGAITVSAPAVSGTNTLTLQAATATSAVNTLATAVASTSGTSIDFTGLPSWIKKVTVLFSGVSLSATSYVMVQLGTSAGIAATGYLSYGGQTPTAAGTAATTGMLMPFTGANVLRYGSMTLFSFSGNTWLSSFSMGGDSAGSGFGACGGGNVTLAGTLDRIRITTLNGTDTFDAGSVNILYEG